MKDMCDISYIAANAEEIVTRILWPEGAVCPECGCKEYAVMKDGRYRCKHCHKIYNIKTNTIFSGTRIALSKWLICLYLMLESKGVGSNAMARYLKLPQSTCYYMMMKLRCLFTQEDTILEGEVAIDEEYVGGQWGKMCLAKRQYLLDKFMLPKHPKNAKEKMSIASKVNALYKTPVLGMNDGNRMVLHILPNPVTQEDVITLFKKHTVEGCHTVSDFGSLYDDWEIMTGSPISQNNHSKSQFTTEDGRSSNRIEGAFAQWKRQSLDKYCKLSPKYIQLYLDEHCFRFNNRELSIIEKIEKALANAHQIVSRDTIKAHNGLDMFPIRQHNIFNPYEFFKQYSPAINQTIVGGIVYRKEDFVKDC